ncbi:MAG: hypothetical protein LBT14_05675 [Treponema sp.]|nr:hypothetical protein [Treponema sp.]
MPVLVNTVLVPFRNKIVYDGMLKYTPVTTKKEQHYQAQVKERYGILKEQTDIITSITINPE